MQSVGGREPAQDLMTQGCIAHGAPGSQRKLALSPFPFSKRYNHPSWPISCCPRPHHWPANAWICSWDLTSAHWFQHTSWIPWSPPEATSLPFYYVFNHLFWSRSSNAFHKQSRLHTGPFHSASQSHLPGLLRTDRQSSAVCSHQMKINLKRLSAFKETAYFGVFFFF